MNILHTVESYYPSLGGMQEVVRQLSERLVRFGHQVTVAARNHPEREVTFLNGVKVEQFKISGNLGIGIHGDADEIKRYQDLLLNSQFDIITNFAAQEWACDLTLPLLGEIKSKKVFVPTGFSGLYLPEYRNYFENMKNWMKRYDANVFTSNDYRDINFARENGIQNIIIIPNGADEREFLPNPSLDIRNILDLPRDSFLIFVVGSHTGFKGHDEAIEIFEKAAIMKATLLIHGAFLDTEERLNWFGKLGKKIPLLKKILASIHLIEKEKCPQSCAYAEIRFNNLPKRKNDTKRLILHVLTREEILAAYKQADLFLFPSNIECSPLVLFECMAAKLPFLASDVGNAREIVEWSQSGVILPTTITPEGYGRVSIEESTRMLENLYVDGERRKRMSELGFKAWQDRFTWEKIALEYESLYKNLLKNPKP